MCGLIAMVLSAVLRVRLDVVLSESDQKWECGSHDGGSPHRPLCGCGIGGLFCPRHPVQRHYHPGTNLILSFCISVLSILVYNCYLFSSVHQYCCMKWALNLAEQNKELYNNSWIIKKKLLKIHNESTNVLALRSSVTTNVLLLLLYKSIINPTLLTLFIRIKLYLTHFSHNRIAPVTELLQTPLV